MAHARYLVPAHGVASEEREGAMSKVRSVYVYEVRRGSPVRYALLAYIGAFSLTLGDPARGSVDCPVAIPEQASKEHLIYQDRGDRCEGFLPLFVAGDTAPQLVGYHDGEIGLSQRLTIDLRVHTHDPNLQISIRALGRDRQTYYRMDTSSLNPQRVFPWRQDLLTAKDFPLKRTNIGILACSDGCKRGPKTIYFPVSFLPPSEDQPRTLSVLLRSESIAGRIEANLRRNGTTVALPTTSETDLRLLPDRLTRLVLPETAPGMYELIVRARWLSTNEPLGSLVARIYVPEGRH